MTERSSGIDGPALAVGGEQSALAAAPGWSELVLQSLDRGVLSVSPALRIMTINQAAGRLLGVEAPAWAGRPLADLLGGDEPLARLLERAAGGGEPGSLGEVIFRRAGAERAVRTRVAALKDGTGETMGALCILEELRQGDPLEAERQEQRALLGRMAASVAHEIRNPLQTLSLGLEYLRKSLSSDVRYEEPIERLQRQIDRVGQIVNAFLAFARPPQPQLARGDIAAALDRAAEGAAASLQAKGIALRREYQAQLGDVWLDAEQLGRALSNLIANAIEAMGPGGELCLRTGWLAAGEWAARVSAASSLTGEVALIEVQDTGTGIPPDHLAQIFEPFFTTKPKGVGLGLAIARRVVEDHGGEIAVRSQPGQGTTFAIGLPRRT